MAITPHILVIDDDADICLLLSRFLTRQGYAVATAGSGRAAREHLGRERPDLVLCDHRLPDTDGLKLLQEIRTLGRIPVIIITGYSDVRVAVELMRRGAFDYVTKPLYPDEILMRIKEALSPGEGNEVVDGRRKPPAELVTKPGAKAFLKGPSPAMELVQKHMDLVAPTELTVLLTGETGVGKEYVARAIHAASKRAGKPFVAIDSGALSGELAGSELFGHVKGAFTGAIADKRGSFEEAEGGTLFLDEVGNLTHENQVRLLRVLQERTIRPIGGEKEIAVNVRILVATNEDLRTAVAEGRFREDLFYRLDEFSIALRPLRERTEDIPVFAEHFREQAGAQLAKKVEGFAPEVMKKLMDHDWPGNLRELRNVVKRAVLLAKGRSVTAECLPTEMRTRALHAPVPEHVNADGDKERGALRGAMDIAERKAIIDALENSAFNKSRTARMLNIDRKTLYNKMKALEIDT